jgi:hypothetical protein
MHDDARCGPCQLYFCTGLNITRHLAVEGQIGAALRTLLNNNGLSGVKLVGYEVGYSTSNVSIQR